MGIPLHPFYTVLPVAGSREAAPPLPLSPALARAALLVGKHVANAAEPGRKVTRGVRGRNKVLVELLVAGWEHNAVLPVDPLKIGVAWIP